MRRKQNSQNVHNSLVRRAEICGGRTDSGKMIIRNAARRRFSAGLRTPPDAPEREGGRIMRINVLGAEMRRTEDGYVGSVRFEVEGHRHPYEAALHSKDGKDWAYGLFFMSESGSERDIDRVEAYLEENDEDFDSLVEAAWRTLES